jgi:hypothetical protein
MRRSSRWFPILAAAASLLPAACRANPSLAGSSGTAPPVETLELKGYELIHLQLAQPLRRLDAAGRPVTFSDAYLVRLEVAKPQGWDELVRFYVGDYQVPEYGGWERGIYFKIYEPALLTRLAGGELRYRIGSGDRHSFGKRLEVPPLDRIPLRKEAEVFPRRPAPR